MDEVHLGVTDRERSLRFWTGVLGLEELDATDESIRLGSRASGSKALIVLHPGAATPVVQRRTGLYHVALHIPSRKELARAIARLFTMRYPNSPTDHLVSETTYLSDPDGNGIELTLETPTRGTLAMSEDGGTFALTADGQPHSGREAVDLDSLFGELTSADDLNAPLVTDRVHHVHLHVADLDASATFYRDLIGFGRQMYVPSFQMVDFGLHPVEVVHALALNSWQGVGAPPAPAGASGLRHFTLAVPGEADVERVAGRLRGAGRSFIELDAGVQVADPSTNLLRVVAR